MFGFPEVSGQKGGWLGEVVRSSICFFRVASKRDPPNHLGEPSPKTPTDCPTPRDPPRNARAIQHRYTISPFSMLVSRGRQSLAA